MQILFFYSSFHIFSKLDLLSQTQDLHEKMQHCLMLGRKKNVFSFTSQALKNIFKKQLYKWVCAPVMDNERGPLPLSLLLTHIHTASALGSPSFPQTAHLTTPRNEGKLFMQNHKGRFKEKAYKTFKMNTHLCCFEYIFKKDKHTTSTSLDLQQW